jgi:uncharacterized protein Yka (UPF0111/DUF47 family)
VRGHSGQPAGASTAGNPARPWWRVLLPAAPDDVGLLVAQGELTVSGMNAFDQWSHVAGEDRALAVRSAQHDAHHARRELLTALQAALSTPVDQEELYVLSERIDRVLTRATDALREAEVLGYAPDSHTASMAERLAEGTRALVSGFGLLRKAREEAGRLADAASDAVHHVERDYREAMAGLLGADDLRNAIAGQVLYHRYLEVADAIIAVADRLWFVVLRGA